MVAVATAELTHPSLTKQRGRPDATTLERKLAILAEHGRAVGRDISEIEISVDISDSTVAEVEARYMLGATLFTIGISGLDYDLSAVRSWLSWRDTKNES